MEGSEDSVTLPFLDPIPTPEKHFVDPRSDKDLHLHEPTKLYGRRWWLVFIFSMLGLGQSATWNFYSPIAGPMGNVYGWSDYLIAWIANTAGLTFFLSVSAWSMVLDTRGPRVVTVAAGILLFGCSALRCIPIANEDHKYLCFLSMVFNGLAAPPIALAAPVISARWFPANERTTATAVMTALNYFGQSVGFIIGPLSVPAHSRNQAADIKAVYFGEAIFCFFVMVSIIAYFPDRPPTPPTISAANVKTEFLQGFRQLCQHRRGWILFLSFGIPSGDSSSMIVVHTVLIFLSFGIPSGIFSGWGAVLNINVSHAGTAVY
jgi:FLVCR family MFS transporter